jgi:transposase
MTEQPGYRDADTLSRLYHDEGLKQREIAERFGVGQGVISDWMSRLDIQSRNQWQIEDEDKLRELYHGENKSLQEVGEELDASAKAVQRAMERFEIPRRDPEHQRGPVHIRIDCGYLSWKPNCRGEAHTVRVHRLVAVAEYGYEAVKSNIVHHKNRHKSDNRPENLKLMTQAEHNREHAEEAFGDD